ncbi:MAG: type II secretion system minor pseudopilin GspH [Paraglaciecola sp.]|nr:type II secretion system minor pseudopilin GspH [Paraglaciecola sp.]NCT49159.1 type II secretion system minor pseudopilin GspH [Paraglaciecola sp.]
MLCHQPNTWRTHTRGFTLLEVMMVLVIMGIAASAIVFNAAGKNSSAELQKQSQRFEVVFNMVADYAILNQQTLGLRVEPDQNSYHFLRLDDNQQWQVMPDAPLFADYVLPEDFKLELNLDDLPWDTEENLFSNDLFNERLSVSEDGVQIGDEAEKKLEPPQILILPSGDITPFSMLFAFEPQFGNQQPVYFRINGEDSTPLSHEGPLDVP